MFQNKSSLTIELLMELTARRQPPCLSLYQPTHRHLPENQQDQIRFRNLLKKMKTSLRKKYPEAESRHFLEPFESLAFDREFWNQTLDGLAVLSGAGLFRVFRLQRRVAAIVVVADSFHIEPLLLAALPEHHRFFRSINHNSVLMAEGLDLNPFVLSTIELRERVWKILGPQYQAWLDTLVE